MKKLDNQFRFVSGRRDILFLITAAFLLFMRQALVSRIPMYVLSPAPHDDSWVVWRAESIYNGLWMGGYNQFTFIKGIFAPMFMALCKWMGLTYMGGSTLVYCLSCIVFLRGISPLLKQRASCLICFTVLLFNPISYALQTWQRVSRNGFSQWQLLLIFGCMIAVYLRRVQSGWRILKWEICAGFALWSFLCTREDGIWIYPFVITAIVVTVITYRFEAGRISVKRLLLFIMPILLLTAGNGIVKQINRHVYGIALLNDRTDGNYAKVVKDLYLIAPDPEDDERFSSEEYQFQYYNIYTSTVEKAYRVSPSLAAMRTQINKAIKYWDAGDELVDGEPFADHILFAIRDGVAEAGHYRDFRDTEALYGQIHAELQQAFRDGRLTKRGIAVSPGSAVLQWKDIPEILSEIPRTLNYVISFESVSAEVIEASGPLNEIAKYEYMTGNRSALPLGKGNLTISGWAFSPNDSEAIVAEAYNADGERVYEIPFFPGEDVYMHFLEKGEEYKNAHRCRFSIVMENFSTEDSLLLRFKDRKGEILAECPIHPDMSNTGMNSEKICYWIDSIGEQEDAWTLRTEDFHMAVQRANRIIAWYQRFSGIFLCIGLFSYLWMSVLLFGHRLSSARRLLGAWWLLTGLLLSVILFCACISYMTVTTFWARQYLYLSPAYVLNLAFCSISICVLAEHLLDKRFGAIDKPDVKHE